MPVDHCKNEGYGNDELNLSHSDDNKLIPNQQKRRRIASIIFPEPCTVVILLRKLKFLCCQAAGRAQNLNRIG